MILFYSLIAVYISWIWVDYFRLIDIYDKERLIDLIVMFLFGCGSVGIVFLSHDLFLKYLEWELTGNAINDLLFYIFQVGLLEELSKLSAFLLFFVLFRKRITEPVDFVIYLSVSALGFAAAENVQYFSNYGGQIITLRSILCSVGHMCDTSLIAYGIVLYKFKPGKLGALNLPLFILLAACMHGVYNFLATSAPSALASTLSAGIYFMFTISLFSTILNNSINNSPLFTYNKVINPDKIGFRLLKYYLGVLILQSVVLAFTEGIAEAFIGVIIVIFQSGFVIIVACLRLSRFKLVKGRWEKLKFELPFKLRTNQYGERSGGLELKGESFSECLINPFFQKDFILIPLGKNNTRLDSHQKAYIADKYLMKNDRSAYDVHLFSDKNGPRKRTVLISKTNGEVLVNDKYPIVGLFHIPTDYQLKNHAFSMSNFKFICWAYIKT